MFVTFILLYEFFIYRRVKFEVRPTAINLHRIRMSSCAVSLGPSSTLCSIYFLRDSLVHVQNIVWISPRQWMLMTSNFTISCLIHPYCSYHMSTSVMYITEYILTTTEFLLFAGIEIQRSHRIQNNSGSRAGSHQSCCKWETKHANAQHIICIYTHSCLHADMDARACIHRCIHSTRPYHALLHLHCAFSTYTHHVPLMTSNCSICRTTCGIECYQILASEIINAKSQWRE